jgi:hypothetical protein
MISDAVGGNQGHRDAGMQRREGCNDAWREILAGRNNAKMDGAAATPLWAWTVSSSEVSSLKCGERFQSRSRRFQSVAPRIWYARTIGSPVPAPFAAIAALPPVRSARALAADGNFAVLLDSEKGAHLTQGDIEHAMNVRKIYINVNKLKFTNI